jgi:hypothetical protein
MAHRRRRRRRRGKISDATPAQPGTSTDESSAASQTEVSQSNEGDDSGADD